MPADGGFFAGHFLDFLEERHLPYVVLARLTLTLKRKCAGIRDAPYRHPETLGAAVFLCGAVLGRRAGK